MLQATTPTFVLTPKHNGTAVDLTGIENMYFSLKQGGYSLKKTGAALSIDGSTVSVYLTQAETVPIREGQCEIQLNWTYPNGARAGTVKKIVVVADNILKEVVE